MPDRLPPLEYPDRFEVRYVSANGGIRWNSRWVNVSPVSGLYRGVRGLGGDRGRDLECLLRSAQARAPERAPYAD
jgi:hypothetical protein